MINTEMLKNSICEVVFTKMNGEERIMKCTKNVQFIPKDILEDVVYPANNIKPGLNIVWDLEKHDWRAFNDIQVKSIKKL